MLTLSQLVTRSRKVHLIPRGMNSNFLPVRRWHFTHFPPSPHLPLCLVLNLNVCHKKRTPFYLLRSPRGLAESQERSAADQRLPLETGVLFAGEAAKRERWGCKEPVEGHSISVSCQKRFARPFLTSSPPSWKQKEKGGERKWTGG